MNDDKRANQDTGNRRAVGEETVLKVAKEVAIKFIEMGRVTPATFDETFRSIHATIKETVNDR